MTVKYCTVVKSHDICTVDGENITPMDMHIVLFYFEDNLDIV